MYLSYIYVLKLHIMYSLKLYLQDIFPLAFGDVLFNLSIGYILVYLINEKIVLSNMKRCYSIQRIKRDIWQEKRADRGGQILN